MSVVDNRPGWGVRLVEWLAAHRAVAIGLCMALVCLYVWPLWRSLDRWGGTFDWGYFFFLAEVDRKSVVEFGQFPLWNPYYCGGAVHLANPQTYFLSPTFLFIWIFGTPVGIRLTLTVAIMLAVDGMRRFLRVLGVGTIGGLVGGGGYAISGAMAQHLGGGHVGWVGFCVLPYVLHSFHRALGGERRHLLYGGLFLAWIFGHFGGYTFPYAALTLSLYGLLWSASQRRLRAGLVTMAFMLVFALALSSVRLLPILEFMRGHPRLRPDFDIVWPREFFEIYVVRHRQRGVPGHPYVWPEYGNYLGGFAMALLGAGIVFLARRRRELWPVLVSMLAFLVFQMGNITGFPWWLLKHLPIFRFMRAPCRFTIVVGLFACVLVGLAVDRLVDPVVTRRAEPPSRRQNILGLVAALVSLAFLIDAGSFNCEQWFQTLTTPPPTDKILPSFQQTSGDRHRMYAYPRVNAGSIDCFEETPLDISPRLLSQPPAEEYPLDASAGTVRRVNWTPNRIVVETNFTRAGVVVVNQNFHPGWRVSGGAVLNQGGLLAARVAAGKHQITFRFLPTSFLVGLGISLWTLGYGVWLWRRWGGIRAMATK